MRSIRSGVVGAVAASIVAVLTGCQGGGTVLVYGKLVDTSGSPPAAAGKVSVGGVSADTNESGYFSLSVPSDTAVKLQAKVTGYATTVKTFTAPSQGSTFIQVTLLRFTATAQFDAATGGSLTTGSTKVTFPANALNATGQVTAKLAWLDPAQDGQRASFPGGFLTADGKQLESFGALAVQVEDSTGAAVNLKAGQTASAKLAVVSSPADVTPMWYFDEVAGAWKQEGSLTGCASGVCDATLPHLSWWNADRVYETTCLRACANGANGNPAVGVQLEARGRDYNGVSYGTTGNDGCACLDIRKSSMVDVVGLTSGGIAGPVRVSTASTVNTCSAGVSACATLPTPMTIETPKFQAILTWNATPSDLDTHFTGPCTAGASGCSGGRFHVYYSSRGSLTDSPYAYLDTDDTSGFGPEITTITRCLAGVYRYSVYRYSGTPEIDASGAKVAVLLPNGTLTERAVPTANPTADRVWIVGDLSCDASCACGWAPVDRFGAAGAAGVYDP
jgi:hypothetical protein